MDFRPTVKLFSKVFSCLVVAQAVFLIVLFLGSSVSQMSQIRALKESVDSGEISKSYPVTFGNTRLDGYTECLGLSINIDGGRYDSFIKRVISAPNVGGCKELKAWIMKDPLPQTREHYFRYWHGEVVVLPIFVAFGLTPLHWLLLGTLLVALLLAALSITRISNALTALALLLPLTLSTNLLATPFATTQGLSNIVIFLGIPFVLKSIEKFGVTGVAIGSALAGAAFNFFDLLTTPALGWALCIFTSTLACRKLLGAYTAKAITLSTFFWLFGFGFTWVIRWLLAMTVWPINVVVNDVIHQMLFRIDGVNKKVNNQFGAASIDNFRYWFSHSTLSFIFSAVAILLAVWALVVLRKRSRHEQKVATTLFFPALIVPFWYELLRNHSQIHTFFTYRSAAISVGIVLATSTYVLTILNRDWT